MRHVLLINSDKLEPVQILAADPTVQLDVITKPKYAPLYEGIGRVWPVDDVANLLQAQSAALQILRSHPIDAIVTPLERSLLTGGFLRSYFGLPGTPYDVTLRFAHKLVMKQHLHQAGLPVTPFERLDRLGDVPAIGDRLGWPIVIKPAIGSGTMNTFAIRSADKFERLRTEGALVPLETGGLPMLAERYVPMKAEYHCDGIIRDGQVVFVSVSRYFEPLLSAMGRHIGSYVVATDDHARASVSDLHQATVRVLGLRDGVTHMELFETADGFLVGEISCRPGGGGVVHTIELQSGVSLWDGYIRTLLSDDLNLRPVGRPGLWGWCGLPCRNGLITHLTSAEEIAAIPGVVEVKTIHRVGERVQEKQTSVFNAGIAFFRVDNEQALRTMLDEIGRRYRIEVSE